MGTQKKGDEKRVVHPLLTREIRPIYNWHEWLTCWQAANNLQTMEGLLHVGFNVALEKGKWDEKKYDETDRLIFYFSIADGHRDYFSFLPENTGTAEEEYYVGRDSNGNVIRNTPTKLRQRLAQKAFDQLCLNFFKTEPLGEYHRGSNLEYQWERVVVSEKLFPIVQKFFRSEDERHSGEGVRIRNLSRRDESRSHNERQAVTFLLNLARFMRKWTEPELWNTHDGNMSTMRTRIDAAKPWMVEVLVGLDRLDVLREWILELDEACLTKLKEIALRSKFSKHEHPVTEDRLATTVNEACYLGSKAAWFLKEHELLIGERKRLTAIQEAEWEKEAADKKIKKLQN